MKITRVLFSGLLVLSLVLNIYFIFILMNKENKRNFDEQKSNNIEQSVDIKPSFFSGTGGLSGGLGSGYGGGYRGSSGGGYEPNVKSIEELDYTSQQRLAVLYAAKDRKFTQLDDVINEFSFENLTIPQAVAKLSNDCNVLCGIEVIPWPAEKEGLKPAKLSTYSLSVQKTQVRKILDKLVSLDPNFVWFEEQKTANLVMRKAYERPDYPINKVIKEFNVEDKPYSYILFGGIGIPNYNLPALFLLPEIRDFLGFGGSARWPTEFEPRVSVDITNATARQIINYVGREVGMSWCAALCTSPGGEPWVAFVMYPNIIVPQCSGNQ